MELRPYQYDIIERAREAFKQGKRSPIIVLPCGAGKSFIAAYMAKQNTDRGWRVLFMVHRIEIVRQIVETFAECGVNMDLCDIGMVQTFTKRISLIQAPSLIITDENHHGSSRTYKNVYEHFPNVPRIGFTATPCRLSGAPLSDVSDCIIEGVNVQWLIDNNYLSPFRYFAPQLGDMTDLKKRAGEYDTAQQEAILAKPKIYGDIILHYKKLANGKKAILYAPTVKYSKDISELFNAENIPAAHIDGTTLPEERKKIMKSFRDGNIKILCNNEIISEGVSVDDCEVCILLRKTASLTLFTQQSMRCMRYMPEKTAIIIDHVGNYLQHGMVNDNREWSLEHNIKPKSKYNAKGELQIKQCPECFMCFQNALICPFCHSEYKHTTEEIKQIKSVELTEIKARQQEYKNKYKENAETVVRRYSSVESCRNATEVMAWCKVNNKKYAYGYHVSRMRGFL